MLYKFSSVCCSKTYRMNNILLVAVIHNYRLTTVRISMSQSKNKLWLSVT